MGWLHDDQVVVAELRARFEADLVDRELQRAHVDGEGKPLEQLVDEIVQGI